MSSSPTGLLYLLPNVLGDAAPDAVIPAAVLNRARSLEYLIAEDPKAARAFLKRIGAAQPVQSIRIERLDHNTPAGDFALLLEPMLAGRDAGLVRLAHERGVRVVPLSGPSSIVLALSASGLEGQRFAFHGYLPVA